MRVNLKCVGNIWWCITHICKLISHFEIIWDDIIHCVVPKSNGPLQKMPVDNNCNIFTSSGNTTAVFTSGLFIKWLEVSVSQI